MVVQLIYQTYYHNFFFQMSKTEKSDSIFSQGSYSSGKGKEQHPKISIEGRFYFKSVLSSHGQYMMYKGVDVQKIQWVYIYGKRADSPFKLSSSIPEVARNQICPKVLWSGQVKSSKLTYFFEVQERYGPSLKTLFSIIKRGPKQKQILHLLLQLIKLVEKMNNLKLICGQLDPQIIVFDASPSKHDLYMLNSFKLKKKPTNLKLKKTKFSSRGVHIGRNLNIKDDLESVCYILIDIFLQGQFLHDKNIVQYEEIKLSGQIDLFEYKIPKILSEFYHYIISLNFGDQINFFYWKNYLTKNIEKQMFSRPYGFMFRTGDSQSPPKEPQLESLDENDIEKTQICEGELEEQNEEQKQNRVRNIQKRKLETILVNQDGWKNSL